MGFRPREPDTLPYFGNPYGLRFGILKQESKWPRSNMTKWIQFKIAESPWLRASIQEPPWPRASMPQSQRLRSWVMSKITQKVTEIPPKFIVITSYILNSLSILLIVIIAVAMYWLCTVEWSAYCGSVVLDTSFQIFNCLKRNMIWASAERIDYCVV